ncbi:MAG TPA: tetratricopeptide repeat protein [Terracidiphilus sp.]|jgi:TolA-binding protein
MKIAKTLRNRLIAAAAFGLLLAAVPVPAHATSKDMIELQTQVQQLLDMVQRLQSTVDTRFGVLQHLVEQTADSANQMTATVNTLQQKINAQNEGNGGKLDTVSGQVQSLNDSVDELKSRIAKLDKSVQDMQTQLQNIQTPPAGAAPAGQPGDPNAPQGAGAPAPTAAAPAPNPAPPLRETFQGGVRDYNAAHYSVAASEFQDVLHYYPMDDLAGTAQFYLGEIAYRQLDFAEAIKDYNAVLEGFPGSPKASAAQLRKGLALLQTNKKEAGIHELRQLIQRHPQTPEAAQARTKLNGMGVRISATR